MFEYLLSSWGVDNTNFEKNIQMIIMGFLKVRDVTTVFRNVFWVQPTLVWDHLEGNSKQKRK